MVVLMCLFFGTFFVPSFTSYLLGLVLMGIIVSNCPGLLLYFIIFLFGILHDYKICCFAHVEAKSQFSGPYLFYISRLRLWKVSHLLPTRYIWPWAHVKNKMLNKKAPRFLQLLPVKRQICCYCTEQVLKQCVLMYSKGFSQVRHAHFFWRSIDLLPM